MWWIIGGIVILIVGGLIIYQVIQNKDKKNSASQKPEESHISPPQTDLPTPSKEEELEKYLLEKRLDLKKYFVFNLGELQTLSPREENRNWRIAKNRLDNDLTKLTVECQKHLAKQGYKKEGNPLCKNRVYFFKDNNGDIVIFDNEFVKDLDQKITNGNWYIIFEKEKSYEWPLGWFIIETDSSGQKWLLQTPNFQLRLKNPSTTICESKEKALEFLKNNDPELADKH